MESCFCLCFRLGTFCGIVLIVVSLDDLEFGGCCFVWIGFVIGCWCVALVVGSVGVV